MFFHLLPLLLFFALSKKKLPSSTRISFRADLLIDNSDYFFTPMAVYAVTAPTAAGFHYVVYANVAPDQGRARGQTYALHRYGEVHQKLVSQQKIHEKRWFEAKHAYDEALTRYRERTKKRTEKRYPRRLKDLTQGIDFKDPDFDSTVHNALMFVQRTYDPLKHINNCLAILNNLHNPS
jgi:hypothetical protein